MYLEVLWVVIIYKWSYKSPDIGYNYRYPTCSPTYNYPRASKYDPLDPLKEPLTGALFDPLKGALELPMNLQVGELLRQRELES